MSKAPILAIAYLSALSYILIVILSVMIFTLDTASVSRAVPLITSTYGHVLQICTKI